MPNTRKGRSPAQQRYDERNPVISIRLSQSEAANLQQIASRMRVTTRELLIRRARTTIRKDQIRAKAWLQGVDASPWFHSEACPCCGAMITFDFRAEFDRLLYRWQGTRTCLHPEDADKRRQEWETRLEQANRTAQQQSTPPSPSDAPISTRTASHTQDEDRRPRPNPGVANP